MAFHEMTLTGWGGIASPTPSVAQVPHAYQRSVGTSLKWAGLSFFAPSHPNPFGREGIGALTLSSEEGEAGVRTRAP